MRTAFLLFAFLWIHLLLVLILIWRFGEYYNYATCIMLVTIFTISGLPHLWHIARSNCILKILKFAITREVFLLSGRSVELHGERLGTGANFLLSAYILLHYSKIRGIIHRCTKITAST